MSQPSLFDTEPEAEPSDLAIALQEITDAMDKWQVLLTPEDWAVVRERVELEFRITSLAPEKPTVNPSRRREAR